MQLLGWYLEYVGQQHVKMFQAPSTQTMPTVCRLGSRKGLNKNMLALCVLTSQGQREQYQEKCYMRPLEALLIHSPLPFHSIDTCNKNVHAKKGFKDKLYSRLQLCRNNPTEEFGPLLLAGVNWSPAVFSENKDLEKKNQSTESRHRGSARMTQALYWHAGQLIKWVATGSLVAFHTYSLPSLLQNLLQVPTGARGVYLEGRWRKWECALGL